MIAHMFCQILKLPIYSLLSLVLYKEQGAKPTKAR